MHIPRLSSWLRPPPPPLPPPSPPSPPLPPPPPPPPPPFHRLCRLRRLCLRICLRRRLLSHLPTHLVISALLARSRHRICSPKSSPHFSPQARADPELFTAPQFLYCSVDCRQPAADVEAALAAAAELASRGNGQALVGCCVLLVFLLSNISMSNVRFLCHPQCHVACYTVEHRCVCAGARAGRAERGRLWGWRGRGRPAGRACPHRRNRPRVAGLVCSPVGCRLGAWRWGEHCCRHCSSAGPTLSLC